jgi:DNA-binding NarL/FixJ family response regulator
MTYPEAAGAPLVRGAPPRTLSLVISYKQPIDPRAPRVVIVDSDRRVQASLAELLRVDGQLSVAGQAGDVRAALELIDRERPDAVILDPRLPDIAAGAALVSSLKRGWPQIRIVMTSWNLPEERPDLAAHAAACVSKSASPEEFVAAVVDCCRQPEAVTDPSHVESRQPRRGWV